MNIITNNTYINVNTYVDKYLYKYLYKHLYKCSRNIYVKKVKMIIYVKTVNTYKNF